MKSLSNIIAIKRLLRSNFEQLTGKWKPNSNWGFLVYSEEINVISGLLKQQGVQYSPNMFDYQLQLGDQLFSMKLIYLKRISDQFAQLMQSFIEISQFTFPWDETPTLFRALDRFHELEEFISINNLKHCITGTYLRQGVNSKGQRIQIITFDKNKVNYYNLVQKFMSFLQSKNINESDTTFHCYITNAFPWQQPTRLRHFDNPVQNDRIIFGLHTFLAAMRELSYKQEPYLDFIGLCALKLAFCDDRKSSYIHLDYEIVDLIIRSLKRMAKKRTYIKNKEFNLHQYAIDRNSEPFFHDISAYYFQYRFQDYFKSMTIPNVLPEINIHSNLKPHQELLNLSLSTIARITYTIKLVDEPNILKKLSDMPNSCFIIDCKKYTKMSHQLFCNIVKFKNVHTIILDTNYKWSNLNMEKGDAKQSMLVIDMIGNNCYKFAEGFIASLRNIVNSHNFHLVIHFKLKNYKIFKDLNILDIKFARVKLTTAMLIELRECNFKRTVLIFDQCSIDDDVKAWKLLNELNIGQAIIKEDETTWQFLFEYAANQLTQLRLSEFQFKIKLDLVIEKNKLIDLNCFKFTLDNLKLKVEIRDQTSGDVLDLYKIKNNLLEMNDEYNLYALYK